MTTVGELLYNARTAKKLTLEQVEKATKIRSKFVEALEKNEFNKLPPRTFAKGFIKNYASYLGLSIEEVMAFYRRQVSEERPRVLSSGHSDSISKRFALTPQLFTAVSVVILLVAFFAYLVFSYITYAGSPQLLVSSPGNNIVIHQDQVEVRGKTDPEATLAINNQAVPLGEGGSFDVKISLQPGLNTLTFVATNKFQRQSIVTLNIRLEQ